MKNPQYLVGTGGSRGDDAVGGGGGGVLTTYSQTKVIGTVEHCTLNPSKLALFKFHTVRLKLFFEDQATDNLHIL